MSQMAGWHTIVSLKNLFSNVSSAMLMEHFLCDEVGGKHKVFGMVCLAKYFIRFVIQFFKFNKCKNS